MAHAGEMMISDVVFIEPTATIREALLLFSDRKVSGAPVLYPDHKLAGMLTVGDVLKHLEAQNTHVVDVFTFVSYYSDRIALPDRVHEVMTEPVSAIMTRRRLVTVAPGTPIEEVARIFSRERFKKLPVVQEDRVVGVISRGDLVRYIVREMLKA